MRIFNYIFSNCSLSATKQDGHGYYSYLLQAIKHGSLNVELCLQGMRSFVFFLSGPTPGSSKKIKYVSSEVQTRIVKVEGKDADHLITTEALLP